MNKQQLEKELNGLLMAPVHVPQHPSEVPAPLRIFACCPEHRVGAIMSMANRSAANHIKRFANEKAIGDCAGAIEDIEMWSLLIPIMTPILTGGGVRNLHDDERNTHTSAHILSHALNMPVRHSTMTVARIISFGCWLPKPNEKFIHDSPGSAAAMHLFRSEEHYPALVQHIMFWFLASESSAWLPHSASRAVLINWDYQSDAGEIGIIRGDWETKPPPERKVMERYLN